MKFSEFILYIPFLLFFINELFILLNPIDRWNNGVYGYLKTKKGQGVSKKESGASFIKEQPLVVLFEVLYFIWCILLLLSSCWMYGIIILTLSLTIGQLRKYGPFWLWVDAFLTSIAIVFMFVDKFHHWNITQLFN